MKSRKLYYISRFTPLFLRSGGSRLKVEEIAASIGITKKTLYNHFESKQEMIECFLDYLAIKQKKEISKLAKQELNPIELLVQTTKLLYNSYRFYRKKFEIEIQPRYQENFQNIIVRRRDELQEFILLNLNKGISMNYIEHDLNVNFASKFLLLWVENLFLSDNRLSPLFNGEKEIDHVLYYQLKGICTPRGLEHLRKSVNFKINL